MYKAVLIVGPDNPISEDIRALYSQQGYLLIGDSKTKLSALDLKDLQGNIGPYTRITILAHGIALSGKHRIDGMLTKHFLAKIAEYNSGQAMHVYLHSCFSGAASSDVSVLPIGSTLVCHSGEKSVLSDIGSRTILQSNQDLSTVTAVEDFIQKFLFNVKQPATLSIRADDGSIFKYAIRMPKHLLSDPNEIIRYFAEERNEFLDRHNEFIDNHKPMPSLARIPKNALPELTEQDATEWKMDNFLYLVSTDDAKLSEITKHPEDFADCINNALSDGLTALMLAAKNGYLDIIGALATIPNLKPNLQSKDGWTALVLAAISGKPKVISALASIQGIDPNLRDYNGFTALMWAAADGKPKVIRALASIPGIDPNLRDNIGMTALMWAADDGKSEVIRALASIQGIDPNLKDTFDKTALMWAAENGHTEAIRTLLLNFNIKLPNDKQIVPSNEIATMLQDYQANPIQWLLDNNADIHFVVESALTIDTTVEQKQEILTRAVSAGNLLVIEQIIAKYSKTIDINFVNKDGRTLLMHAAIVGRGDIIEQLLKAGADINVVDRDGKTAMDYASDEIRDTLTTTTKAQEVEIVVNAGLDADMKFINAITQGSLEEVKSLLEAETHAKIVSDFGGKALDLAVIRGDPQIVDLLLKAGANITAVGENGKKAIDYAATPEIKEPLTAALEAQEAEVLMKAQEALASMQSITTSDPNKNSMEPIGHIEDKHE